MPTRCTPKRPRTAPASGLIAAARRASAAGLIAAAALLALPAAANVYSVLPDGSGDFPTIQAAVNASTHGDIIELGDGVFTGTGNHSIDFGGRRITVRSAGDDPAACTIDLQGTPTHSVRAFEFSAEGPQSVVRGITIANGYICGS